MLAEGKKRGLDLPLLKQTLACYEEARRTHRRATTRFRTSRPIGPNRKT